VLLGYRAGGRAPILNQGEDVAEFARTAVDPLPQALVLTSIVIGLAVTALMVAIALRIYEKYGTFDLSQIRRLKG
jgi:multicomponent Na+:H+ antiporter subunit C